MKSFKVSTSFITGRRYQGDLPAFIRESVGFHKRMGFDALDFSMSLIENRSEPWQEIIETALEAAAAEGIRFASCHLPFSWRMARDASLIPDFCRRMHMCIDAAAALGVDAAVLHPNSDTIGLDSYDGKAEYESNLAHLAPFAEHAARVGLPLALENMRVRRLDAPAKAHRFGQDPEELCRMADELGMGICWDFGHANTARLKQSEALAYVGKRLKHLHINDNDGYMDSHVPPFSGSTDWQDAMLGLKLAGYQGSLNFELGSGRLPPALHESFAATMLATARVLERYIEQ